MVQYRMMKLSKPVSLRTQNALMLT